ncbi:MAG: hypothetical protein L3J04_01960 [Robiginitomaculum sp.]|nr:hypothetical protein [Robiginitomaculum sp.]
MTKRTTVNSDKQSSKKLPKHMRRYLTRLGLGLGFYGAMLGGSIVAINKLDLTFQIKATLAVLTAAPIVFIIWAISQLLADPEMDEFEKMIMVRCSLYATGLVLTVATVWGFLENFAEVGRFPLYMMFPLFWIFFGIVNPLVRRRFK